MRFFPFVLLFFFHLSPAADQKLCPRILLKEGQLKLNENERILICGSDSGGEGWRDIPLKQAQIQITNIFQTNGYLHPRFEIEDDELLVWRGPQTKVGSLQIQGGEAWLSDKRKRKIVNEPLMPAKLDEATRWAERVLRTHGFACPTVKAYGQEWDRTMLLQVHTGPQQTVAHLEFVGLDGLHPDTLARYLAFQKGEQYDVRATLLTTYRLLGEGLFQSAYFTTQCDQDKVNLELRLSVGKPKLLRFGVGASTEEFPFVDLIFKNARLDDRASSFTALLHASPLVQRLDFLSELYFFRGYPKSYLGPRAQVKRESERSLEEISAKSGADLGANWDAYKVRYNARFGPTINYSNTVRGIGPDDVKYLSFEGSLLLNSHSYELYLREQYEGWMGSVHYQGQKKGLGSSLNVDRYDLEYKYLWNVTLQSPPLLVLGARLQGSFIDADDFDQTDVRTRLPKDYRIFLGGNQNLRGFPRQSLNSQGLGYLSAVYLGLEARLVEEIPFGIQPFLLWDLARLGTERFQLGRAVFTSEGVGVRWASPFGTLRGSIARGRIWGAATTTEILPQQWIYFFSFGQEF